MSDVAYIQCDGCGSTFPEPPGECRRFYDGWGAVSTAGYVRYDLCPECLAKALAAVGMRIDPKERS